MADKKSAGKKPKAIVDVAHPGTSAPPASGKPVIVTNRPMLKDPMVVGEKEPAQDKPAKSTSTAIKVKVTSKATPQTPPLEDVSAAAESETTPPEPLTAMAEAKKIDTPEEKAADAPETHTKPAAESSAPDKETAAAPKSGTTEKKSDTPEGSAENSDEAANEEVPTVKSDAQQEAEAAATAEHDATIQKLINGRQYFLPINSVEKRKSKRFVLLGVVLSVLLALAWADIALDAGLVHVNGVKPLTHFFSN